MWHSVAFALLFAPPMPPLPAVVTAPTCVGCRADLDEVESRLDADRWERLRKGEIVTIEIEEARTEDRIAGQVYAMGIIPRSPEAVWRILTDFHRWPKFLPKVEEVRVTKVEGDRLWLYHLLKILIAEIEYTVIYTFDPERGRASWVLDKELPHDIGDTTGFWEFVPVNDGRYTLATYHAKVDTGMPVPGFVEEFLTRKSLPQIIAGLREAVVQRTAPTKGTPGQHP